MKNQSTLQSTDSNIDIDSIELDPIATTVTNTTKEKEKKYIPLDENEYIEEKEFSTYNSCSLAYEVLYHYININGIYTLVNDNNYTFFIIFPTINSLLYTLNLLKNDTKDEEEDDEDGDEDGDEDDDQDVELNDNHYDENDKK